MKDETLLVLDLHKAQKSDYITDILKNESNITPVFVPAGATGIIQPLDVSYNAPFKKKVEEAALKHMNDHLDDYLHGKFTAGQRRVLITQWVGDAWEELSKDTNIAVRSFKKCGISTAADGSEDFEIHLEGLEDYEFNGNDIDMDDGDPFADLSGEESSDESSDEELCEE